MRVSYALLLWRKRYLGQLYVYDIPIVAELRPLTNALLKKRAVDVQILLSWNFARVQ